MSTSERVAKRTADIRRIAKRLHDAAPSVPNEAPHFLSLTDIAEHLTIVADMIDRDLEPPPSPPVTFR